MDLKTFIIVREGEARFGIPITSVLEVVRVPDGLGPGEPVRYHGSEIPVIELSDYTGGIEEGMEGPERLLMMRGDVPTALKVARLEGIFEVDPRRISPTGRYPLRGPVGRSLKGVAGIEGEFIFILDAAAFVADVSEKAGTSSKEGKTPEGRK